MTQPLSIEPDAPLNLDLARRLVGEKRFQLTHLMQQQAVNEIGRLRERVQSLESTRTPDSQLIELVKGLVGALEDIAEATSAEEDAGENYRWDDREGALDYAYATARQALGGTNA